MLHSLETHYPVLAPFAIQTCTQKTEPKIKFGLEQKGGRQNVKMMAEDLAKRNSELVNKKP